MYVRLIICHLSVVIDFQVQMFDDRRHLFFQPVNPLFGQCGAQERLRPWWR
jgi:hypothetical protein